MKGRHRVKTQFELNGPWRLLFPTYPKRKQCLLPVLNPKLQTPSSPKNPGTDAGKIPIIRSRAKLRLSMLIKPSFEGKPLTDPSPDTIPRLCSPFPTLVTSCPPPFRFDQEPFFFSRQSTTKRTVKIIGPYHSDVLEQHEPYRSDVLKQDFTT